MIAMEARQKISPLPLRASNIMAKKAIEKKEDQDVVADEAAADTSAPATFR